MKHRERMGKKAVAEVFEAVATVFQNPNCWTTMTFARDKDGQHVNVHDKDAVSFCLIGAVEAAAKELSVDQYEVMRTLGRELYCDVIDFNDASRGPARIIKALYKIADDLKVRA